MSPELLMIALDVDHSLADEISLIIFDNCHLVCDSKHPYTNIMKVILSSSFFYSDYNYFLLLRVKFFLSER